MKPLKIVLPFAVLAAGIAAAAALVALRPSVSREAPERALPAVRVETVRLQTVELFVDSHGTVMPRTESSAIPEVSGTVTWVAPAFASGGFFERGELLIRVDPRDYEVALERERANLARRSSELERAAREFERRSGLAQRNVVSARELDDAGNAERVARASLREAQAALEKAERDVARCEIRAPFAGRVRDEHVDVGQFVNRGAALGTLYAIDEAEVRLPVPDDALAFLDLPLWRSPGSPVPEAPPGGAAGAAPDSAVDPAVDPAHELPEVELRARFAGAEHVWRGRIVRTEGEIDPKSRMVHVVARVADPYARSARYPERPPLSVGLFVSARIRGRSVDDVAVLPRSAMRGRDRVLVVDDDDRIRVRRVEVLRGGRDSVTIEAGLRAGERVAVSALDTVVDGMRVAPVGPPEAEPPAGVRDGAEREGDAA